MTTKEKPVASRYLDNGILKRWHSKTLDAFDNDEKAKEYIRKYLKELPKFKEKGVGVYLYGKNGVGKSHLMMTVFKELLDRGEKARVTTLGTLVTAYTSTWYNAQNRADFQKRFMNVAFLGIEEIGKEYRSDTSNLAVTVLDSVLRYRLQAMKPTWATSNISASALTAKYTGDIAAMFREMAFPLNVIGEDKRVLSASKIERMFD